MTKADDAARRHAVIYDTIARTPEANALYEHTGFTNLGRWDETTATPAQAAANLTEKVLGMLPHSRGTALDVAGTAGTAAHLARRFGGSQVVVINVSSAQLEYVQERLPEVRTSLASATAMPFEAASFDAVVCVEAACHFETRGRFLREAFRVLKPNGYLVLSDFTCKPGIEDPAIPEANRVGVAAYRDLVEACGFEVTTFDVDVGLAQSRVAFRRYILADAMKKRTAIYGKPELTATDLLQLKSMDDAIAAFDASVVLEDCVFVAARKPG